jgi:hypothetical protein
MNWIDTIFEFIINIFIAFVALVIGFSIGVNSVREEAVDQGVAEYFLNEENDKDFRFLTPMESEE